MATEETEVAAAAAPEQKGGLVKTLGIAVGLFALMLASQLVGPMLGCMILPGSTPGCQTTEVAGEQTGKDEPAGPPLYLAMDPPLVVSFEDKSAIRFLQATVELMTRDEETLEALTSHMPVIRNNLLMLFGSKTVDDLTNTAGKEQLRQDALSEIRAILEKYTGKAEVEDLYFTSFVVQ